MLATPIHFFKELETQDVVDNIFIMIHQMDATDMQDKLFDN